MGEYSCASKTDNNITERKATVVPRFKIKYVRGQAFQVLDVQKWASIFLAIK